MTNRALWMTAVFLGCASLGWPGQRLCTQAEAKQAEETASHFRTWAEIQKSFQQFGHCDDGAIAEGYSEAVTATLADRWDQVSELQRLASHDRKFKAFVLRHVDELCEASVFDRLVANAAVRCPPSAKAACGDILKRSRELEQHVRQLRSSTGRRPTPIGPPGVSCRTEKSESSRANSSSAAAVLKPSPLADTGRVATAQNSIKF